MTQLSPQQRDWLSLYLVPGIGPKLAAALLDRFGTAAAILDASPADLLEVPHLPKSTADLIKKSLAARTADSELELMAKHQVQLIPLGTPDYPPALATIDMPPRFLYLRGTVEAKDAHAIAIVGSRQCTSYGQRIAERLASDLAQAGYTIVSGLARGIDACAHRGAMNAKGRTIAVLAGGLSKIYPPEHTELAEAVAASGALLTESAMCMEPMAGMFPARNRIISGLCRAVVLVEAKEKSGALITARHAAQQGREVFAVPGPVDSIASAGTLRLLRDGARIIRDARDLLDDLKGLAPLFGPSADRAEIPPAPAAQAPAGLDAVQQKIWDFLSENRNVDDLGRHLQLPVAALTGALMTLELKKVIRRLPGSMYERG